VNRVKKSEPVFVVGMNGSGTTMLLDNLGRHPQLYAFPRETRLIPHLIATHHRFDDLSEDDNFRRLWEEVLGLTVFEYVNDHQKLPLPDDWQSYPRDLAGVLDGVFSYFARKEGKQRWCEKTPHHVQHISKLADLFPLARFIHVIRDGRDCAASFNRRWHRSPELTMFRWKKVIREGCRQGRMLGKERYMEVRYEDLTTDPEYWLQQICNFLGVPFDHAVLLSAQPYLKTAHLQSGEKNLGGLKPNSGNWRQYFTPGKISDLEKIGGSTLKSFGYETAFPDSDRNLSKLKRHLLSAKDALVQYLREIGLKLSGRIERPWRVILSRPFIAFRQRGENEY
jgi:Sulfotransferase family